MKFKMIYLDSDEFFIALEKLHDEELFHEVTLNLSLMAEWISNKFGITQEDAFNQFISSLRVFRRVLSSKEAKMKVIEDLNNWLDRLKGE